MPVEEEELDSQREIAEQIMTGFHCTENNNEGQEQQAGFITDTPSYSNLFLQTGNTLYKNKIAMILYLHLTNKSTKILE